VREEQQPTRISPEGFQAHQCLITKQASDRRLVAPTLRGALLEGADWNPNCAYRTSGAETQHQCESLVLTPFLFHLKFGPYLLTARNQGAAPVVAQGASRVRLSPGKGVKP